MIERRKQIIFQFTLSKISKLNEKKRIEGISCFSNLYDIHPSDPRFTLTFNQLQNTVLITKI